MRTRVAVLFTLDPFVNFFAVNRHVLGSIDADPHLISLDAQNSYRDLVTDHHGFADSSCQYQHIRAPNLLPWLVQRGSIDRFIASSLPFVHNEPWYPSPKDLLVKLIRPVRIQESSPAFLHVAALVNNSFN